MGKSNLTNESLNMGTNLGVEVSKFTNALLKSNVTKSAVSSFASMTTNSYTAVINTILSSLTEIKYINKDAIEKVTEILENADKESYEHCLQQTKMIIDACKYTLKVYLIIVLALIVLVVLATVFLWEAITGIFGWIIVLLVIWLGIKAASIAVKFI